MNQSSLSVSVPLQRREDGTIRVADTRVTLDRIVAAFQAGATAEEIAQDYSALNLADIYAVIAYVLTHRSEVDTYLHGRRERADEVRREIEAASPDRDLRERLLARQRR